MVCQENVKIIVMLCKLEDNECTKCEKYWPDDFSHFRFGMFLIENVSVKGNGSYIHRALKVKWNNNTRTVHHFQFLSWTLKDVPSSPKNFTVFVKQLIELSDEYPVVVHSEGGCGRTGIYILCDIILRMSIKEKKVDFFKTLEKMRNQRGGLVSNLDQYIFSHFVLLEYYFGKNFSSSNKPSDFVLKIQEAMQESAVKRFVDRLDKATEHCRTISLDDTFNNIRVIAVDCFNYPGRFIVTEEPSANNLCSFWNLVANNEVEIVIWLNGIEDNDEEYSSFWPKDTLHWSLNESNKLDIVWQENTNDTYNTITIKIDTTGKSEEKFVKIIYVKTWERTSAAPSNTKGIIDVCDKIVPYNGQIVVTCYDGTTASGLFVALVFLLEKINTHRCCNVFEAAKTVKQNCAQFLKNPEQIKYLYEAALEYVRKFNIYEVVV
ncbi:receptor-type tyrosine-protein phosphatase T-like [Zophobas morio]|uniref:receptor-type tyrosine-protein phosphatase T-like n=1 Tax=Zophobas morio TaxID=2755281 RepID=UPI0030835BDE